MHTLATMLVMATISLAAIWTFYANVCLICSVAHTVLPPWEMFSEFPRIQKYYKLFIYVTGWLAVNQRSNLYRGLSTQDGTTASPVATAGTTKPTQP